MSQPLAPTTWGPYQLEWGTRTYIMGIVNATPDSFSGDGLKQADLTVEEVVKQAVSQAQHFAGEGATFIDVGGESTRPHALRVSAEEELARVIPVIRAMRRELPPETIISIDTYKAIVAEQAIAAGANLINDIWGFQYDPDMAVVAAEQGVPVVLMANMRGIPKKRDIISDILRFLSTSIDKALAAGVEWERIIIDPGIGFGMTPEEDVTVLRRLGELRSLGRPILLGTSRKSHIGRILGGLPASERLEGTAATVALGIAQGADIVRVHDVREMLRVARMSDAVVRGSFALE